MSENILIVGTGRMGLVLGAALKQMQAVERLVYFGRAMEPPPHPLFDGDGAAEYHVGPQPIPSGINIVILKPVAERQGPGMDAMSVVADLNRRFSEIQEALIAVFPLMTLLVAIRTPAEIPPPWFPLVPMLRFPVTCCS